MSAGRTIRVVGRDARFQRAQTLKLNRTKRRRAGLCFVEGVLPITAALRGGGIAALWYAHDRALSRWAAGILAAAIAVDRVETTGALLDELSDRGDGVELAALVHIPVGRLDDVGANTSLRVLVLDRPSNPGNIGTSVRCAAGFGATAVVIAGHAADPFDPKAIAASRGAVFALPIIETPGAHDITAWRDGVRAAGVYMRLVGASATAAGAVPIDAADLRGPVALVLGSEASGLSHGFLAECDVLVHIPMDTAAVDSLNAGVAAGIVLYEAARQAR